MSMKFTRIGANFNYSIDELTEWWIPNSYQHQFLFNNSSLRGFVVLENWSDHQCDYYLINFLGLFANQ